MPVKYDLPKRITKSQPERFTYQGRRRIHILRVRWSGSPQGIFLRSRSFDTTPPEKESCNIPIASIGFRPGEKARREREGVQDPTQSPQTPSFLGEESVFSNYKTFSLPDPRETKIRFNGKTFRVRTRRTISEIYHHTNQTKSSKRQTTVIGHIPFSDTPLFVRLAPFVEAFASFPFFAGSNGGGGICPLLRRGSRRREGSQMGVTGKERLRL